MVQSRREDRREDDVLADQASQHRAGVGDDGVQVEDARLQQRLAAEAEQLSRERRGPFARLANGPRRGPGHGTQLLVGQQQFTVAVDQRQQVVEVVRHATGELSDRLHLLRLPQLVFEVAPLGDVLREREQAGEGPVRLDDRRVVPLAGDGPPVLGAVLRLAVRVHVARDDLGEDSRHVGPRLLGHDDVERVPSQHLRFAEPEHPFGGRVPAGVPEVGVGGQVGKRHALDLDLQPRQQMAAFGLGPLPVRDVAADADEAGQGAGRSRGAAPSS